MIIPRYRVTASNNKELLTNVYRKAFTFMQLETYSNHKVVLTDNKRKLITTIENTNIKH